MFFSSDKDYTTKIIRVVSQIPLRYKEREKYQSFVYEPLGLFFFIITGFIYGIKRYGSLLSMFFFSFSYKNHANIVSTIKIRKTTKIQSSTTPDPGYHMGK